MNNPGTPTFDQLRIFLAIVDTGSFAAAGRKLNRAVSVISYGISNLEAQLGLSLFDREGTRKPQLTVAGRALLAEARSISHGLDGLRAKVKGLRDGLEATYRELARSEHDEARSHAWVDRANAVRRWTLR